MAQWLKSRLRKHFGSTNKTKSATIHQQHPPCNTPVKQRHDDRSSNLINNMMNINPSEADRLIIDAEKKLVSSNGFFKFIFGGTRKIDDAIDCYKRAAILYKMTKNWESAGSAFCKAANLSCNQNCKHQAALDYEQAAICYKKTNLDEAENCLLKSIVIYTDLGRFTMAAKNHETIASMYEGDATQVKKVVQHYEQASDYYRGEESNSSANKCLLKVAHHSADAENYEKAVIIYEQVAMSALETTLLKYSAKEYFFKALLCSLCVDSLNAKQNLDKYEKLYPAFSDSRECKFVKKIMECLEDQNVDALTVAVKDFDAVQFLDMWFTRMLLRIKRGISGEPDLR